MVIAACDAVPVDMTMESVETQMQAVMGDDLSAMKLMKSTFDDLQNLGFSEDECKLFHDMTATQGEHTPIDAVKIDSVDNVWDLTIKSPVGDQFSGLVLKSSSGAVKGHVLNKEHGNQQVLEGRVEKGDTLVWKCKLTKPVPLTLTYTAQVDKDQKIQGKVVGTLMGKTVMDSSFSGTPVFGDKAEQAKAESAQQAQLDAQKSPGSSAGCLPRPDSLPRNTGIPAAAGILFVPHHGPPHRPPSRIRLHCRHLPRLNRNGLHGSGSPPFYASLAPGRCQTTVMPAGPAAGGSAVSRRQPAPESRRLSQPSQNPA